MILSLKIRKIQIARRRHIPTTAAAAAQNKGKKSAKPRIEWFLLPHHIGGRRVAKGISDTEFSENSRA